MTFDQHATAARVVLVPNRHLLFRCKYLGLGVNFGARVAFGADVVLQQLDDFLTGLTEPPRPWRVSLHEPREIGGR